MKKNALKRKGIKFMATLVAGILLLSIPICSMAADKIPDPRVDTETSDGFEGETGKYLTSLSKTVAETDKFRHYNVSLVVDPTDIHSVNYGSVDVVLLIDRSESMKEKVGDKARIVGVEEAARTFVNTLLPNQNSQNKVSVVSFCERVVDDKYTTGLLGFDDKNTLISSLSDEKNYGEYGSGTNGSTNIQAGIIKAKEVLGIHDFETWSPDENGGRRKVIILLTDGEPTDRYSDIWKASYTKPDWWNEGDEYTETVTHNDGQNTTELKIPAMGSFEKAVNAIGTPPGWWSNDNYLTIYTNYPVKYNQAYGNYKDFMTNLKSSTFSGLDIQSGDSSISGTKRWSYLSDEAQDTVKINGIPITWTTKDTDKGGECLTSKGNGSTDDKLLDIVTEATRLEGQYTVAQGIDLYTIDYSSDGGVKDLLQSMVKKMDNPPTNFGDKFTDVVQTGSASDNDEVRVFTANSLSDIKDIYQLLAQLIYDEGVIYTVTETLQDGFEFVLDQNGLLTQPANGEVVLDTTLGNSFTWTFTNGDSSPATYTFKIRVKDEATLRYPLGAGYGNNIDEISVSTSKIVYTPLGTHEEVKPIEFKSPKSRVIPLVGGSVYITNNTGSLITSTVSRTATVYLGAQILNSPSKYTYQWYKGGVPANDADLATASINGYAGSDVIPYTSGAAEKVLLHQDGIYAIKPVNDASSNVAKYYIKITDTEAVGAGYQYGTIVRYPLNVNVTPSGSGGGGGGTSSGGGPGTTQAPTTAATVTDPTNTSIGDNGIPLVPNPDGGTAVLPNGVPKTGDMNTDSSLAFTLGLYAVSISVLFVLKKRKISK